jgi:hypothetical protein
VTRYSTKMLLQVMKKFYLYRHHHLCLACFCHLLVFLKTVDNFEVKCGNIFCLNDKANDSGWLNQNDG